MARPALIFALLAALAATDTRGDACAPWSEWDSAATVALTQRHSFPSATIGESWSFLAYLPPSYATSTERYPCLFWLHGGGGDQTTGATFVSDLDDAIRRGVAPEMIVILVQGPPNGWWIDGNGSSDWPVESAVLNDLVPYVDATFRTLATREGRGIEGFSMGGCGAARLGLEATDRFGLVSILAGGLQDENYISDLDHGDVMTCVYGCAADNNNTNCAYFQEKYPFNLATAEGDAIASGSEGPTYVRLAVGTADDKTYSWMTSFDSTLTSLGITHTFQKCFGVPHDYVGLYDSMGDSAFQIFNDAWGAVAPVNEAPLVSAGSDLVVWGLTAQLAGTVTDDGVPSSPGAVSTYWYMTSGLHGRVTYGNRRGSSTTVTAPGYGTFVFELQASDGEKTSSDEVRVTFRER